MWLGLGESTNILPNEDSPPKIFPRKLSPEDSPPKILPR
jgi:hypothetical protein